MRRKDYQVREKMYLRSALKYATMLAWQWHLISAATAQYVMGRFNLKHD
jgi:hypothetical protein